MSQSPDDDIVIVALPKGIVRRLVTLASLFGPLSALAGVADRLRSVARVSDPLVTFIRNPVRFIWGVLIIGLLTILQQSVIPVLEFINLLLTGTPAVPGIADLPLAIIQPIIDGFGFAGEAVLGSIAFVQAEIFAASQIAGPFAPLIAITLWGAYAALVVIVTWRVLLAVATLLNLDSVMALLPGGT